MDKQLYCKQLIEYRQAGYTLKSYYMRQRIWYLSGLSIFLLALFLIFDSNHDLNAYSTLIVGLYIGTISRDVRWVMATKRIWPVKVFVTNWEKVEGIANGEN